MSDSEVEQAVRLILPAVNLDPTTFHLESGFVARALKSGKPRTTVLDQIETQLVFVGVRSPEFTQRSAPQIAREAYASLAARDACEQLIVSWIAPDARAYAAAYISSIERKGQVDELVGASWIAPEQWPVPMVDAAKTSQQRLDDGLARVECAVHARDPDDLDRALKLVQLALELSGGESPNTPPPERSADDAAWSSWHARYAASIQDEWRRLGNAVSTRRAPMLQHWRGGAGGKLSGRRAFVSYARPDAASLALPVVDALRSCGADVWFDQDAQPSQEVLDAGLADAIAACDTYVLCASDEFFERAGYATQELAAALRQSKRFVVVAPPATLLPSYVESWPRVEIGERTDLTSALAEVLGSRAHIQPPLLPDPEGDPPLPNLAGAADMRDLWRRAAHVQRFNEIDLDTVTRIAGSEAGDRRSEAVRKKLLELGEGLEWSGTLQDMEDWPHDSMLRDLRLRLAALRAVAGTRWPLSGSLQVGPFVDDDVEILATRNLTLHAWPTCTGWDESSRRFALRHHASLLRLLQELLLRGLFGGLFKTGTSTLDHWCEQISLRRRECYDAVLELRTRGALGWGRERADWIRVFNAWFGVLKDSGWEGDVPSHVLQHLLVSRAEISAAAANTGWHASRSGECASQLLQLRAIGEPATLEVFTMPSRTARVAPPANPKAQLRLGLCLDRGEIQLSWSFGTSTRRAPSRMREELAS